MRIIITSDVDFVSESIIQHAYKRFENIPITIFITHESNYINKQKTINIRWEIEPHPNFIMPSSHGESILDVFNFTKNLETKSLGFRCHKYYSSNDIYEYFYNNNYRYTSNICTNLTYLKPFIDRSNLINIPVFFEDGTYLKNNGGICFSDVINKLDINSDNTYVFNFHPIHIILNSYDYRISRNIKDTLSHQDYSFLTYNDLKNSINKGYGISSFIDDLLNFINENNIELLNLGEYYNEL